MTNKEAIFKLIKYRRRLEEDSTIDVEPFDLAIEALERKQWIPCSERLPEEDGRYWISTKSLTCEDYFHNGEFDFYRSNVRAWMPLPDPYEIEEQPEIDGSKLTRDEIARILLQWLKMHPGCRIRTDFEVRQGEPELGNFVELQYGNITEVY